MFRPFLFKKMLIGQVVRRRASERSFLMMRVKMDTSILAYKVLYESGLTIMPNHPHHSRQSKTNKQQNKHKCEKVS